MFGRPSLANAELQARHDREYRELLHQEVRQPAVRGVFRNNVRIIRRPRPVARLVFQGNVERHFDQEVAGWHAAANEPDSPRTHERCLRWAFIEAARALEEFAERQAVAPTSHQDDNGGATVSNPEVATEGDAPANVADDARSEKSSDGESQAAATAEVHLNLFGKAPEEVDERLRRLALNEVRLRAQSEAEIARPQHRRGFASPVGSERLGQYSHGTVTPSDEYEFNPIWCRRTGLLRLGFSYCPYNGSGPILPDGHYDICDASCKLPTIPSWLQEHTQSRIACYAPTDFESEDALHFINLSGQTADPERAAIQHLLQSEADNHWPGWRRGFMPEGADLEDVLYQRGIHPLRSNARPNPFYVPVVPQTVPSPVRLQTLPRTAVRPVFRRVRAAMAPSATATMVLNQGIPTIMERSTNPLP
jgi:hypothetical protein